MGVREEDKDAKKIAIGVEEKGGSRSKVGSKWGKGLRPGARYRARAIEFTKYGRKCSCIEEVRMTWARNRSGVEKDKFTGTE